MFVSESVDKLQQLRYTNYSDNTEKMLQSLQTFLLSITNLYSTRHSRMKITYL